MTYWDRLREVIEYLQGKNDIYDGAHWVTVEVWNDAWDEMVWMGIEPDTVEGIQQYIAENE